MERTLSTEKADRLQRALTGLSGRLSGLTIRLGGIKDAAIALQGRVGRLAALLKKL